MMVSFTTSEFCEPLVLSAFVRIEIEHAFECSHQMASDDIKLGVHYVNLDIHASFSVLMVEEGGQVTFKEPPTSDDLSD